MDFHVICCFILAYFPILHETGTVVDVHGYTKCPDYPENSQDMDLSTLEFDVSEEGFIIINGYFTVLNDISSPYPLHTSLLRKQLGQWRPTLYSQDLADFCAALKDPLQPYYKMAVRAQQSCPFKSGHIQTFTNLTIDFPVSWNFIGDWKIISKSDKGNCTTTEVSIYEL